MLLQQRRPQVRQRLGAALEHPEDRLAVGVVRRLAAANTFRCTVIEARLVAGLRIGTDGLHGGDGAGAEVVDACCGEVRVLQAGSIPWRLEVGLWIPVAAWRYKLLTYGWAHGVRPVERSSSRQMPSAGRSTLNKVVQVPSGF